MKKKEDRVGLRLEPKLKKEAQREADKSRVKLSHWIRELIVERLERRA